MATSYFSLFVMNPRSSEDVVVKVRRADLKAHEAELAELCAGPEGEKKIDCSQLRDLMRAEIAIGRGRAFLPRSGLYASVAALLDEVERDKISNQETRQGLERCLRKALDRLNGERYLVASVPEECAGVRRLSEVDVSKIVVPPCSAGEDSEQTRSKRGEQDWFTDITDAKPFLLSLLQGEAQQIVIRIEHDGPTPLRFEQYAKSNQEEPLSAFTVLVRMPPDCSHRN